MIRQKDGFVRRGLRAILCAVFFAGCYGVSFAQSQSGIDGNVKDEQGGSIAGAEIRVSTANQAVYLNTGASGEFHLRVPTGAYLLEVKAFGFANFTSEVIVRPNTTTHLEVRLKVGAVSETVVVTANGTAQTELEVAKAVSTIESSQIEERRELLLAEALRGTPSLRVQQQGSPGTLTTVRLRGLRAFDTAVLLEGLRVRDASDINGSALSLLTDFVPAAIDRVEILRGSGSSIYGTNAIGGVINLLPATGSGAPQFEFGFEGGGLKTFRERFQASGGTSRLNYNFGLNRLDVRNGIDGDDAYGNSAGLARVQAHLRPGLTVVGNLFGTIANTRINDSPFALAAAFTGGTFPLAVAGVNFQPDFNNPDQGRRNRLLVGSIRVAHEPSPYVAYTVAFQRVDSNRRNYNGPAADPHFASFYPFGDFEFLNINKGTTDTFDARVTVSSHHINIASAGFEYESESFFQHSQPTFSAFNDTTDTQRTFAVFGHDQLSLFDERLQLSVGIRGQWFRLNSADRPGFLAVVEPRSSVTGDGAVAYLIRSTGTKLRAHVGNGFRAPSLFERFGAGTFSSLGFVRFGDPTLKAEQSIGVDAGFDQMFTDRARLGATYFYTRLQRVISFRSFANDPLGLGRFGGFVNEAGGLARGLEFYGEVITLRGGNLRFAYTYTNSDRLTPNGLRPEYVVPKHLFAVNFSERYRSFLLSLELNHTGAYLAPVFENNFPSRAADLRFSGYAKLDLFGSYEKLIAERTSVMFFVGAENLLKQTYYENGFRAPGIVARAGMKVRFR